MSDVKTGDKQIREFLDTPLTRSRSQGSRRRPSSDPLLWINVWGCLIVVLLLFQTVYPIIMAHRAERKVEEYLEQLGNVRSSVNKAMDKAMGVGIDEGWDEMMNEVE